MCVCCCEFLQHHGDSEPSSDGDSWLSELPSSPSTPPDSPRLCPGTDAITERFQRPSVSADEEPRADKNSKREHLEDGNNIQLKDCSGVNPFPKAGLSSADANAAVASLQQCIAACIPKVGGRVTPLLNNSTLDDAGWIVSGARNVSEAQVTSQAASARSFLAFACTEPWEVLLLLHASAATARALSHTLQSCADVCSDPATTPSKGMVIRHLAARRGVYERLAAQQANLQHHAQEAMAPSDGKLYVSVPHYLTLVEATQLQKGREFRVFAAGGLPVGRPPP